MEFTWNFRIHFGYFGVGYVGGQPGQPSSHVEKTWAFGRRLALDSSPPFFFGSGRSWRAMPLGRTPSSLGMLSSRPARGSQGSQEHDGYDGIIGIVTIIKWVKNLGITWWYILDTQAHRCHSLPSCFIWFNRPTQQEGRQRRTPQWYIVKRGSALVSKGGSLFGTFLYGEADGGNPLGSLVVSWDTKGIHTIGFFGS